MGEQRPFRIVATSQDWEIVLDDNFIYKRRKRETPEVQEVDDLLDEEIAVEETQEEKSRKRRTMLLKMKEVYSAELKQWEDLFAKQEEMIAAASPPSLPTAAAENSPQISLGEPIYEPYEELRQQFEELEFFINKHTDFCVRAEEMNLMLNEMYKNTMQELPSPHQIFNHTTFS